MLFLLWLGLRAGDALVMDRLRLLLVTIGGPEGQKMERFSKDTQCENFRIFMSLRNLREIKIGESKGSNLLF